jgi:YHS domain-containing protein
MGAEVNPMNYPAFIISALLAFAPALSAQQDKPTGQPADAAAAKPAKVLAPQAACPVSGEPLGTKANFVSYQGHRIYTCCEKCPAKISAFPDLWLFRMAAEGYAPENVQTTCPVSGEALENKDHFVNVGSMKIYACCEKCVKKIKADPAKAMDTLQGRKPQASCPVSGKPISGTDSFEFQGVTIKTCCPNCPEKFKAEPEKYLKAMAERNEFVEQTQPVCLTHPNEKIKEKTFFTTAGPMRFYFANQDCMTQFFREPAKYVPALRGGLPGPKQADVKDPAAKEPAKQPGN